MGVKEEAPPASMRLPAVRSAGARLTGGTWANDCRGEEGGGGGVEGLKVGVAV